MKSLDECGLAHNRGMDEILVALTEPDELTLRFAPGGMLLDRKMRPGASAAYLDSIARRQSVDDGVPFALRQAHERIIQVHMHGLFDYGLFSVAEQLGWMFPEAALGVRFVSWYAGRVPIFLDAESQILEVVDYGSIAGRFRRAQGAPRVTLDEPLLRRERHFNGSFASLLHWGRATGVLRQWLDAAWSSREDAIRYAVSTGGSGGYRVPSDWPEYDEARRHDWWHRFRTERWEPDQLRVLVDLRNMSAHQRPEHTVSPIQSAQAITAAVEFVNALWMTG
jgi:hypothetical protein